MRIVRGSDKSPTKLLELLLDFADVCVGADFQVAIIITAVVRLHHCVVEAHLAPSKTLTPPSPPARDSVCSSSMSS